MRLFVAVLPPPEAVDHLREAIDGLHVVRAGVLEPPERWHLTLVFLGEVSEPVFGRLAAAAGDARSGPLALAGAGRFGERVLWAGVAGDVGALAHNAEVLRRHLGVEAEPRPYQPHLTLARPRARITRDELREDVDRLRTYRGPTWAADRYHLMSSTTGAQGVRYESLDSWVVHQA
ncbi:RNA 2',3'-cyclic phosphodiesterase [Cryptosporangium phraense]|uniref:RNA 2',3'-cyclic phosphodiesterase n=1 Tax=Cryptosporangium phraense TaxID=2593070 RepID=UPI0014793AD1|nr:RNA 2',3'-cyclic phosphodiesterase [Cryptosporangium phraense]